MRPIHFRFRQSITISVFPNRRKSAATQHSAHHCLSFSLPVSPRIDLKLNGKFVLFLQCVQMQQPFGLNGMIDIPLKTVKIGRRRLKYCVYFVLYLSTADKTRLCKSTYGRRQENDPHYNSIQRTEGSSRDDEH